ncbi:hypothetical protein B0H14DRAFT_3513460 [Mycena olivaceomarginata]|nr:hypothetical protein B0H14DRAFT_3513460 [Mycena olivaceomarginata]
MPPPTVVKRDNDSKIDASSNKELNELLEKYPIDNNPLFTGKRIFHNETGYFDLSDIKLRVWVVAKANSTATIDKLPPTTFSKTKPSSLPALRAYLHPLLQLRLSRTQVTIFATSSWRAAYVTICDQLVGHLSISA